MDESATPTVRRTKSMEVTPAGEDTYRFSARLTDAAAGGDFPGDSLTIHDFGLEGRVGGPQLTLLELEVEAYSHPYAECPFVIPATTDLVGQPLMGGWRQSVLSRLAGTRGCTHVNTLLLGLGELVTMIFFLQINERVPYTPETRQDGRWTGGALDVAPSLATGVCFGLRADGLALAPHRSGDPT